MRELLIATRNAGKVEEIVDFFQGLPFVIRQVGEVPALADFEPKETGDTFEENAIIKAREYGKRANMLTLADDSGIEVEALGGEPGIKSARYAEGTDKHRYEVVLEKMKEVPDASRGARFVSVIAVYDPEKDTIATAWGICNGRVEREPRGERGFGYDPVFYSDELGKTFAEATLAEKRTGDHRGKALTKMREILLADFA